MSVNNGDKASAEVFNAAYLSKIANSTGVAIYELANPSSGNSITNIQQKINDNETLSLANAADIVLLDGRVTVLEANQPVQDNLAGTVDPLAVSDATQGYSVGSTWINITTGKIFLATDVTTGAAVWKRIDKPMLKIDSTYFNNNFTADNVNWLELVADTGANAIKEMQIFYTTGSIAQIGIGAVGLETELFVLQSGGGTFQVDIPANSRISFRVKGTESNITTGIKLAINFSIEA